MYSFLLRYNFKLIMKNKSSIFWLILYPFFLATLFGFVFKNIGQDSTISNIPIMVENSYYGEILNKFDYENRKLFDLKKFSNPDDALKNGDIVGYLNSENDVVVSKNDIKSTIFYNTVNHINHIGKGIGILVRDTGDAKNVEKVMEIVKKEVKIDNAIMMEEAELTAIFFFSLLGMICLGASSYGIALSEENNIENSRFCVKRNHVSPVDLRKQITAKFFIYLSISILFSIFLFGYMKYIINADFGNNISKIIIGIILANLLSILLGTFLGFVLKTNFDAKQGINAVIYVFSSALSGMMVSQVAGFITNKMPLLNYINPGTVISRLFLAVYLENNRLYMKQVVNIFVYIFILIFLIAFLIRRRDYENI